MSPNQSDKCSLLATPQLRITSLNAAHLSINATFSTTPPPCNVIASCMVWTENTNHIGWVFACR